MIKFSLRCQITLQREIMQQAKKKYSSKFTPVLTGRVLIPEERTRHGCTNIMKLQDFLRSGVDSQTIMIGKYLGCLNILYQSGFSTVNRCFCLCWVIGGSAVLTMRRRFWVCNSITSSSFHRQTCETLWIRDILKGWHLYKIIYSIWVNYNTK